MKSWPDKVKEWSLETLETQIKSQKSIIEIDTRDLKIMEDVYIEKKAALKAKEAKG